MVKMGATKSRVDVYPGAGHDLSGLHDIIIAKTITFFADLMGIPPVTATT
jgi:phage portal protein BeeE